MNHSPSGTGNRAQPASLAPMDTLNRPGALAHPPAEKTWRAVDSGSFPCLAPPPPVEKGPQGIEEGGAIYR